MQLLERQWQSRACGRQAGPALALAAALCLLVGCGRAVAPASDASSASAAASAAGDDSASASASGDEAAVSDADLVSAVSAGGPSKAALSVKFRVEARPVVGMPLKIMLALSTDDQDSIDHIHASLTAGEGLLVQSPTGFDLSDLKAGAPQYREVTVLPQQTGVLDLNATLLLQTDKVTQTRTYSIPLIAADNSSSP